MTLKKLIKKWIIKYFNYETTIDEDRYKQAIKELESLLEKGTIKTTEEIVFNNAIGYSLEIVNNKNNKWLLIKEEKKK